MSAEIEADRIYLKELEGLKNLSAWEVRFVKQCATTLADDIPLRPGQREKVQQIIYKRGGTL